METIVVKPEKAQQIVWILSWSIGFVLVGAVVVTILMVENTGILIAALAIGGWLLITVPILAWIPAFYRSLRYVIDSDAIRAKKGVFWRKRVAVPYAKITNIDMTQDPVERVFNLGTVHVQTAGAGGAQGGRAELKLVGVRDLDGLRDTIMERVRASVLAAPGDLKRNAGEESDSAVLKRMLEELTAIREALEKKGA